MRVLVTGGAGYIGSNTARELARRGHEVELLDDLSRGHEAAAVALGLPLHRLSLRDAGAVRAFVAERDLGAVVHFAAYALVAESFARPLDYWRNNLGGTLALLEALVARAAPVRFIFSSTCAVYGVPERVPIPESHPTRPINPYGWTKLAAESAIADAARAHGIGAVALRYFNAAGASDDRVLGEDHDPETHLIPLVLRAARDGTPVTIHGTDYDTPDGTCIRDYIHVADLARAHALALERAVPGEAKVFNIGTGRGASVREVIEVARRVTGRPIEARVGPRRPGDPPSLVADGRSARAGLGFVAERELAEMVESAWAFQSPRPGGRKP